MDNERYLELSARIAGIEYLLKQTLWIVAAQDDPPDEDAVAQVAELRAEVSASLQHGAFPSLAPATSDHVAAMAAEHADRVLKELIDEMETEYGTRKD